MALEKRKEKTPKKTKNNEETAIIEEKKQLPSNQVITNNTISNVNIDQQKQEENQEILYQRFLQILPKWVKAPFVYITPKLPEQIEAWNKNWGDLIVSYAKTLRQHIINLQELREIHPFKNNMHNRQLSLDQMQKIAEYLEKQGLLRWIEPPFRVRIYWKTDEQLSKELYDHMIETGKAVEYWSLLDLRRMKSEDWALLPIEELRKICDILVDKGLAKWIDKEKTILEFQIV